jgi:type II secretory pathway component PulC
MRSSFVLGLCVSALGFLVVLRAVRAEDTRQETASLELRAWGTDGQEVRRLHAPAPARQARANEERPLARDVNAGVISRAALRAQLVRGIGRFLQQVRTEPALAKGQWKGWRLITLFPNHASIQVSVLRAGDTVMRVNGRSIERPEDFKSIWDSLSDATQLVLDIERDGKPSTLRYTIAP